MKVTITRWERETRIRVFGFLYHPEKNNEKLLVTTLYFFLSLIAESARKNFSHTNSNDFTCFNCIFPRGTVN